MSKYALSILVHGAAEANIPFEEGNAEAWGIKAALTEKNDAIELAVEGNTPAVITLWLQPDFTDFFPLIPGFMIGFNSPEHTGPAYPQLREKQDLNLPNMLSPYWGIRADRATVPIVFAFGNEGMAALAIDPYSGDTANGLRVCLKRGIGITIGHTVEPLQYIHCGTAAPAYQGFYPLNGTEVFTIRSFNSDKGDRKGHAAVIRKLYADNHESAPQGDGMEKTIQMLADAMVQDVLLPASDTHKAGAKGELFKIKDHTFGRAVEEIGWTGGAMAAYPFIQLQSRYAKPELYEYGVKRLDRIADSINPASGLFWDCQSGDGTAHANGWWVGLSPEAHYAYTNGHACYYLLKSADLVPESKDKWIAAARSVLDTVLSMQLDNGQFPVSFDLDNGKPLREVGFAGCWFAAALTHLYRHTREHKYLHAAITAAEAYHQDVITLLPCATPMDTHNATDQEGNLALLHTAHMLHVLTGDERFIAMLRDSADFEMLWRYYYNTRPILPPLDTADWGSSGGSVTSAHNPHIHPMHLNSLDQIIYLYQQTNDEYYLQRTRDAIHYGCCCVCRPDEDFGWGQPGWLCERFCPSDGLLIQHDLRTGEPRSVGCDYHVWNVAVTMEGFCGIAWDVFPDLK